MFDSRLNSPIHLTLALSLSVLFPVIAISQTSAPEINEFKEGKVKIYKSDGKENNKGLQYSIKYPLSYRIGNHTHENIAKQFDNAKRGIAFFLGVVDNSISENFLDEETILSRDNFEMSILQTALSNKYSFLHFQKNIYVDKCKAAYIEYSNNINGILAFSRTYFVVVNTYLFSISFILAQLDNEKLDQTRLKFNSYKHLFDLIVGSIDFVQGDNFANELTTKEYLEYVNQAPETDKRKENDIWIGELYRNKKYKFRIVFPKDWEYDGGTSKRTIARSFNREKATVMAIAIIHFNTKPTKDSNNIYSGPPMDLKLFMEINQLRNSKVENYKFEKGYLNNIPAYIYEFTSEEKTGTESFIYYHKQIQCLYGNKIYSLFINLPLEEWNSDMMIRFDRWLKSFVFESLF